MFVCCIGTFDSIVRRKEVKKVIWERIYDMHLLREKMPSLMDLLASSVFYDSYGG